MPPKPLANAARVAALQDKNLLARGNCLPRWRLHHNICENDDRTVVVAYNRRYRCVDYRGYMVQEFGDALSQPLHDRYQIQRQLSKKAGRQTFLARDLHGGELVVIKLLLFNSGIEWDDLKLFEREAATLQSLSHEAIPRYLDSFEVDLPHAKGFALVQTYIDALSLEAHLKAGRSFSETEVKQLATSLLEILTYLHDRQPPVIHRDIKPSNVLLTNRSGNSVGQVYLVDFGSVQTIAAREGGTITIVGTYGYMPPEQFGGRATPASDLYSLGATLIYLVTGQHPADLPQKDLRIQFEPVAANLSPGLIKWLQQMTAPSLEKRLTSAQQSLQALEQSQLMKTAPSTTQRKPPNTKLQIIKKDSTLLEVYQIKDDTKNPIA